MTDAHQAAWHRATAQSYREQASLALAEAAHHEREAAKLEAREAARLSDRFPVADYHSGKVAGLL